MGKRGILVVFHGVILLLLMSCSPVQKQQHYTIGIINLSHNLDRVILALEKELDVYGDKDGATITYLYNGPLAGPNRIEQEVAAMLNADVDLIFSMTTPATKKVQEMTRGSSLPVFFGPVFSPVTSGIVDSLAAPGGNMTGIKVRGSTGKALEWFLKAMPPAKRILVPFHYTDEAAIQTVEDLEIAAQALNVELVLQKLKNTEELDTILAELPADIDAVWVTHSYLIISNIKKIITAATALKKPVISSTGQYQKDVMLCYAMSHEKMGKQAARMIYKLLKGASPATMPVETADYFLGLNLKSARMIGMTIPDDVISQADFIIR